MVPPQLLHQKSGQIEAAKARPHSLDIGSHEACSRPKSPIEQMMRGS